MANPSSNFLRGASTAGSDGSMPLPDETAVLMAVGKPKATIVNITTLASELLTTPNAVSQVVEQLMRSGLVEESNGNLRLSSAGLRAIRYANVAKF